MDGIVDHFHIFSKVRTTATNDFRKYDVSRQAVYFGDGDIVANTASSGIEH